MQWDEDLDGPFAAVFVDQRKRTVTVVTDLMAFIPVYEGRHNRGSVVGTHVDAVGALANSCELDHVSMAEFLVSGVVTYPYSCYREVRQLPPAAIATYPGSGERTLVTYWIPEETPSPKYSFGRCAKWLRLALKESARASFSDGDRPTVLVSAGEDSRAVLGAMPGGGHCDAVVFADDVTRETEIAATVSAAYGARFTLAKRSPTQYIDNIDAACSLIGSNSQFFQAHSLGVAEKYKLSQAPVVLGGFGADRLLKGIHSPHRKTTRELILPAWFQSDTSIDDRQSDQVLHGIDSAAWKVLKPEIRSAIIERRNSHRRRISQFRQADSVEEWARMWPSSMASGSSHYTSNRRLMAIHEPFFSKRIVKLASEIPFDWKINRRIFLAAMKPYLGKTKRVPNGKGFYPYYGLVVNRVLLPRLQAVASRVRGEERVRSKHIVWADWSKLVKTEKWRKESSRRWLASSYRVGILEQNSLDISMQDFDIRTKLNVIQLGTIFNSLTEPVDGGS
ncbi:asparagine synthase-related protein [Salinisphaera orenii]|uniref:asparagine synthase-related protein n=1 Tax=Salinisphaera orenii TaxID=856731 RepID=UPI00161A9963|nr:asparagine synthase-related protein [Salinisphaera halophila]